MKKDYFDLDQAIMQCWQTSDDLDLYIRQHIDGPEAFDEDKQMNIIHGIIEMNKLRCQHAMNVLKQVFQLDEFCDDPVKLAAREDLFKPKKGKK